MTVFKRGLDWHCAVVTMGLGVVFSHGHEASINIPPTEMVFGFLFDRHVWGNIFFLVGLVRIIALLINGRSPRGAPLLRGGAALVGTVLWSHLCLVFIFLALEEGDIRIGLVLFGVELLSDIFSSIRAGVELGAVRHRIKRRLADINK